MGNFGGHTVRHTYATLPKGTTKTVPSSLVQGERLPGSRHPEAIGDLATRPYRYADLSVRMHSFN